MSSVASLAEEQGLALGPACLQHSKHSTNPTVHKRKCVSVCRLDFTYVRVRAGMCVFVCARERKRVKSEEKEGKLREMSRRKWIATEQMRMHLLGRGGDRKSLLSLR